MNVWETMPITALNAMIEAVSENLEFCKSQRHTVDYRVQKRRLRSMIEARQKRVIQEVTEEWGQILAQR